MADAAPHIIAVAGPNGAGKTSRASIVLRDLFGVNEYVNADAIAQGLSAFSPEAAAIEAGRVMLLRLARLCEAHATFAFETTLSGRAHARWIKEAQARHGYEFQLMFVWLNSPELAVHRVRQRVRERGHHIEEAVVRRRYAAGLRNFFDLYGPLADSWGVYDNSVYNNPHLVAVGGRGCETKVMDEETWRQLRAVAGR